MTSAHVTVVIATRDRWPELARTLRRLTALPDRPEIIVVDNASTDGTATSVRAGFPGVRVIALQCNRGAVARNTGVEQACTPYVAFCDDDTWWEPGALSIAAGLLDAHDGLASVTARIVVEPGGMDDPIVPELNESPVPAPGWLPGPALLGILAGATMLRVTAFREVGGFSSRLWLGGEEELLAIDLAARGWYMCYRDDVVVHHAASPERDPRQRRRLGIRNTLWTTWLRRPVPSALRRTGAIVGSLPRDATSALAVAEALAGLAWVVRERRVVPRGVEQGLRLLEGPQRRSAARRYIG